jgi:hypothetical protein
MTPTAAPSSPHSAAAAVLPTPAETMVAAGRPWRRSAAWVTPTQQRGDHAHAGALAQADQQLGGEHRAPLAAWPVFYQAAAVSPSVNR